MANDDLKRVSREEAIALGLKFYLPLEPCVRGHFSKRRTNNNQCTDCLRIHKAKFRRENTARLKEEDRVWRRANRAHINSYRRRQWAKKKEEKLKLIPLEMRNCIITLSEARASGSRYYFTGKNCKRGHLAKRFVPNRGCVECLKENCKEWGRQNRQSRNTWARNNRDKIKASRFRCRDKRRASERARYAKNPQKHIKKVKAYYQVYKERIKANHKKEYYERLQNDPIFRAKSAARVRRWAKANPERVKQNAAISRIRRRKLKADGVFTAADVRAILKAQRHRCAYCKKSIKKNYVMDHIIPLARGGSNDRKNMQATCAPCNQRKHARDPLDFARSLGMLL
jgi:5-methylcytosine-specific restriction endonuclease McrA